MANRRAFEIAFVGLKPGLHEFSYVLDDKYFAEKGAEDFAADIKKKTADLNSTYETKARDVNAKIKSIFE